MLTTILVSVIVPLAVFVAWAAARNYVPRARHAHTDMRGIALQTVVVIVVLLAIAGAVAGVLLTRGQDAQSQLEGTAIGPAPIDYTNQALCEGAGLEWITTAKANTQTTHDQDGDGKALEAIAANSCAREL